MESIFKGRRALVIGGTSGIGLAIARLLKEKGSLVSVTGRTKPTENYNYIQADYAKTLSLGLQNAIPQECETSDFLVFCYGPFVQKPIEDTTDSDWTLMALANYAFPGAVLSRALPKMAKRGFGRILLFGGTRTDAVKSYRTNAAYAGAKTGISVLVKSVAACYANKNITCNAILPGFTHDAPLNTKNIDCDIFARHALHLLSSEELNGVLLNVDRGWTP